MVGASRVRLWVRALLVWLSFGVVAVVLGTLRVRYLEPALGALASHQIGTLAVVGAILLILFRSLRWLRPSLGLAWAIGAGWVLATVAFEIGVFRFGAGLPWSTLLAEYDVAAGRLWLLVLVTQFVGLPLALWISGLSMART